MNFIYTLAVIRKEKDKRMEWLFRKLTYGNIFIMYLKILLTSSYGNLLDFERGGGVDEGSSALFLQMKIDEHTKRKNFSM